MAPKTLTENLFKVSRPPSGTYVGIARCGFRFRASGLFFLVHLDALTAQGSLFSEGQCAVSHPRSPQKVLENRLSKSRVVFVNIIIIINNNGKFGADLVRSPGTLKRCNRCATTENERFKIALICPGSRVV